MGEQTILCGMLQAGTIVCYNKMVSEGISSEYATKFLMHGWNVISEALKWGGITNMMDRLSNPAKIKANELSKEIKKLLAPLYQKHMDDIISGKFSSTMMEDWKAGDKDLLTWREETGALPFEKNEESKEEKYLLALLHRNFHGAQRGHELLWHSGTGRPPLSERRGHLYGGHHTRSAGGVLRGWYRRIPRRSAVLSGG